jgi:ABC-type Co2+ transport system permease subunit
MTIVSSRKGALPKYFAVVFAMTASLFVLAGFTRTFFIPLVTGTFSRPWFVYVHAILFFSWIPLLVGQALLIVRSMFKWHRRLGWMGAAMILPMAASGAAVAYWATRRDVAVGKAADALPFFFGALMDMILFASLAIAAVLARRRSPVHKRLMLLATIAILGAAIGRIPVVGAFSNYIAVALMLSIAAGDIYVSRHVHRATLLGGAWLLIGIFTQGPIGNTNAWISIAQQIVGGGQ